MRLGKGVEVAVVGATPSAAVVAMAASAPARSPVLRRTLTRALPLDGSERVAEAEEEEAEEAEEEEEEEEEEERGRDPGADPVGDDLERAA